MIYQVRAVLYFDGEDEANDFIHDCQIAAGKSITINPGQENEEHAFIEKIINNHDENPVLSCSIVSTFEPIY